MKKIKIDEDELYPHYIFDTYGTEIELTDEEYEQLDSAYTAFFTVRQLIERKLRESEQRKELEKERERELKVIEKIIVKDLTSRKEKGRVLIYFGWTQTDTSEWTDPNGNKHRLAEAYEKCKLLYQFKTLKDEFRSSLKEQLSWTLKNWGCANIEDAKIKAETDASLKEALNICGVLEQYNIVKN